MAEAYIVAAKRTAGGRKGGALADWHPGDLGAQTLNAIVDDSKVDPQQSRTLLSGCVSQAGEQSNQIGRTAVLASNLPQSVPAVTDRQTVRLVAAKYSVCCPSDHVRHARSYHRRRYREHVTLPHGY